MEIELTRLDATLIHAAVISRALDVTDAGHPHWAAEYHRLATGMGPTGLYVWSPADAIRVMMSLGAYADTMELACGNSEHAALARSISEVIFVLTMEAHPLPDVEGGERCVYPRPA